MGREGIPTTGLLYEELIQGKVNIRHLAPSLTYSKQSEKLLDMAHTASRFCLHHNALLFPTSQRQGPLFSSLKEPSSSPLLGLCSCSPSAWNSSRSLMPIPMSGSFSPSGCQWVSSRSIARWWQEYGLCIRILALPVTASVTLAKLLLCIPIPSTLKCSNNVYFISYCED